MSPITARNPHEEGEPERIQCDLCPRDGKLREGQRGASFVRHKIADRMVLNTYFRSSWIFFDPVGKKPPILFYSG